MPEPIKMGHGLAAARDRLDVVFWCTRERRERSGRLIYWHGPKPGRRTRAVVELCSGARISVRLEHVLYVPDVAS